MAAMRTWRGFRAYHFILVGAMGGGGATLWASAQPTPQPPVVQSAPEEPQANHGTATPPDDALPQVSEGSLVCRSPISGRYEFMPLQHTDVDVDVRGLVASTTVTQRYANDTDRAIEAVYVFPLPHEAAVYDMEIRVGDRLIKSVIKERQEARRTYEQAKASGRRAGLVEQERPNIFTMSVANIMPSDVIDVRLRYVEPLRWDDGRLRVVFPMVVGPRYIPGGPLLAASGANGGGWAPDTNQVPDASRITPPVRHPETRPSHDVSLRVGLDVGVDLSEVTSPSHPIRLESRADGGRDVRLADDAVLPNRDFVLEVRRAGVTDARSALFLSRKPSSDETHFMLVAFPPTLAPEAQRPPLEMIYVIDISGSMHGTSIQQARDALLQGLSRLRTDDRFDVIAFNDRFRSFQPAPIVADSAGLEQGRRFVRALEADGGTEMLPALKHVMAMPRTAGVQRYIVLLTDGCLGNEDAIFTALEHELGDARLFTVAIGSAPNHYLATKMAEFGRGSFTHIADVSEVSEQMARLLDRFDSPVLSDLELSFDGGEVEDVSPKRPPDLFLREPLVILGRVHGEVHGRLRVSGHGRDADWDHEFALDTAQASFHPGITTLWARARVGEAMNDWRRATSDDEKTRLRAAIVADAIRYNLVTRFTSLVAVEERIANTTGLAPQRADVATELPHGWTMEKVFGVPATGTADLFLQTLAFALLAAGAVLRLVSGSRLVRVRS
jgi:Ca-activated chloride channel family protein